MVRPLRVSLSLQERVVLEHQTARLQVDLAGAGLDRDQLAVDDLEDEPVDVGQLLARLRRPGGSRGSARRRSAGPAALVTRCQGCSVGMSGSSKSFSRSLRRNSWTQSRAPLAVDRLLELLGVGVFLVELLQVVGRAIDEQLVGRGQRRDEEAVGLGPRPSGWSARRASRPWAARRRRAAGCRGR